MTTLGTLSVLVIDSEDHAAGALVHEISERGHCAVRVAAAKDRVEAALGESDFDAVVLDFHTDRPQELAAGDWVGESRPGLPMVVLASPGIAMQRVEEWRSRTAVPGQVVRKPLRGEHLFAALGEAVARRRDELRVSRYASLIAEGGRAIADSPSDKPALSEQAILFTDIRRSTELISSLPLSQWFDTINNSLSAHGAIVRRAEGSVVKYTGDGILATFRGRGRARRALDCAFALQEHDRGASRRDGLRVGIGLAKGVVMTGLIGEPRRRQYDVIGATVHLASRLCSLAAEGEIVATPRLVRSAGLAWSMTAPTRRVQLRGFSQPVECVSFAQANSRPLFASEEAQA